MDITTNLRQMATAKRRPTAPGHPERGSHIEIDGTDCTVTSSVQIAGSIHIYALDASGAEHTVRIPMA